jgi:hypothetical protein
VLGIPSKLIATCFALVCFAAAIVVGLAAGNPAMTVLWRALLVMGAAWLVGQVVGAVLCRALEEHVEQYRQQHPLPGEGGQQAPSGEATAGEAEAQDAAASQASQPTASTQ